MGSWYRFLESSILKKHSVSLFSVLNRVAIFNAFCLKQLGVRIEGFQHHSPNPTSLKFSLPPEKFLLLYITIISAKLAKPVFFSELKMKEMKKRTIEKAKGFQKRFCFFPFFLSLFLSFC